MDIYETRKRILEKQLEGAKGRTARRKARYERGQKLQSIRKEIRQERVKHGGSGLGILPAVRETGRQIGSAGKSIFSEIGKTGKAIFEGVDSTLGSIHGMTKPMVRGRKGKSSGDMFSMGRGLPLGTSMYGEEPKRRKPKVYKKKRRSKRK